MIREINEVNEVFTDAYNECPYTIPFKMEWSNKVGYFDHAVEGIHAPTLESGEMAVSRTPGGRRIIFIGTLLGNLVVFDRFTEQDNGQKGYTNAVFVRNCPEAVEQGGWFSEPTFDEYEMRLAVGDDEIGNLGWRIEQLDKALQKIEL